MKTYLVTGATRGIGRAIAERLLSEGHTVYGVYKESNSHAGQLTKKYGKQVHLIQANLANKNEVDAAIKQLTKFRFDGIVNNAGIVYLTQWERY